MDTLLAESTVLLSTPLPQEESHYDQIAKGLVSRLNKLSAQDIALARDNLDVYRLLTLISGEADIAPGNSTILSYHSLHLHSVSMRRGICRQR